MKDKPHFNAGRSPSTKTPPEKIAEIRQDWPSGDPVTVIAARHEVSRSVVINACSGLRRAERAGPLVTTEVDRLLNKGWGT